MECIDPDLKQDIFSIMYEKVCRYFHYEPLDFVKPTHNGTVLKFVADRLKIEDWIPIIVALRYDNSLNAVTIMSQFKNYPFLHNVDTAEMAIYLNRFYGSMWTQFIFSRITESIAVLLENSKVLTVLELNGLPLFLEYLERLVTALKKNKTLKHLSFENSDIKDEGCKLICEFLQNTPNVESINLSRCLLTSKSGEYITRFIKIQQINRYCDCWPSSSYEDLLKKGMDGIKKINLNHNTDFKDKGFECLLITLEQDMWLKALDLQDCGITEELSSKIIQTIKYNLSLKYIDLRNNLLSYKTINKIMELMDHKKRIEFKPKFKNRRGSTLNQATTSNDPFTSNNPSTFIRKVDSNVTNLNIAVEKSNTIFETPNITSDTIIFTATSGRSSSVFKSKSIYTQELDANSNETVIKIEEEKLKIIDNASFQETPNITSDTIILLFTATGGPLPPVFESTSTLDANSNEEIDIKIEEETLETVGNASFQETPNITSDTSIFTATGGPSPPLFESSSTSSLEEDASSNKTDLKIEEEKLETIDNASFQETSNITSDTIIFTATGGPLPPFYESTSTLEEVANFNNTDIKIEEGKLETIDNASFQETPNITSDTTNFTATGGPLPPFYESTSTLEEDANSNETDLKIEEEKLKKIDNASFQETPNITSDTVIFSATGGPPPVLENKSTSAQNSSLPAHQIFKTKYKSTQEVNPMSNGSKFKIAEEKWVKIENALFQEKTNVSSGMNRSSPSRPVFKTKLAFTQEVSLNPNALKFKTADEKLKKIYNALFQQTPNSTSDMDIYTGKSAPSPSDFKTKSGSLYQVYHP